MDTSLSIPSTLNLQTFKNRYARQLNKPDFESLSSDEQTEGMEQIVLQMGEFSGGLVAIMTEAVWEVYSKALWNPRMSFGEWADDISTGFDESTKRQFRATARAIERVIAPAWERQNAGQPILDYTGTAITPERLLKRAAYVRTFSYQIEKSPNPERWIRTIVSGKESDLDDLKAEENPTIRIPIEVRKEEDCYRLELLLSEEQYEVVKRLLKRVAQFPALL